MIKNLAKRCFSFQKSSRLYGNHPSLLAKGIRNPFVFRNMR